VEIESKVARAQGAVAMSHHARYHISLFKEPFFLCVCVWVGGGWRRRKSRSTHLNSISSPPHTHTYKRRQRLR
jgi:hypothetical protein